MKALVIAFAMSVCTADPGRAEPIRFHVGGDDFPPFACMEDGRPAGLSVEIGGFEAAKRYVVGTIRGYAAEKTLLETYFR